MIHIPECSKGSLMRKWHRFIPTVSAVSAVILAVEVLSATQKW